MIKIIVCGLIVVCSNWLQSAEDIKVKKKEVVDAYATSDDIVTFWHKFLYNPSGSVVRLNLTGTQEKEILSEVMVPQGNFYAYTLTNEFVNNEYLYVVNLSDAALKKYKMQPQGAKRITLGWNSARLYAAGAINNTIVAVTDYTNSMLWFSNGRIEYQVMPSRRLTEPAVIEHVFALSGDGNSLLELKSLNSKLYYTLYNGLTSVGQEEPMKDFDRLSGASFNPMNNNMILYYNNQKVFVTKINKGVAESSVLKKFSGDVIKAIFSNDGSCIYVLAKQNSNLSCYRFSDLKQKGELNLSYRNENIDITNVVNSPDNEQLFVECRYSTEDKGIFTEKSYDLVNFDFGAASSVKSLYLGEKQSFDVRADGNLIVCKTGNKIHFYDCFLRKKAQDSKSIDGCKAILGFSADGFLWLRMEPPVAMLERKKSDEDYLLCYKVRKKEDLEAVAKEINEKLDLNNCLDLLNNRNINRNEWDQKLYKMLGENSWYEKAYKKSTALQYVLEKTKKKTEAPLTTASTAPLTTTTSSKVRELAEVLQESRELRAEIEANDAARERDEEQRAAIKERERLLIEGKGPRPPSAPPTLNIFQRAVDWIADKIRNTILQMVGINAITITLRVQAT